MRYDDSVRCGESLVHLILEESKQRRHCIHEVSVVSLHCHVGWYPWTLRVARIDVTYNTIHGFTLKR